MTVRSEPERAGSVFIVPVRVESEWYEGPLLVRGYRDIRRVEFRPKYNVWHPYSAKYLRALIYRGPDVDDRREIEVELEDGDEFVHSQDGVTDDDRYHYIIEPISIVGVFEAWGSGYPACDSSGAILFGDGGSVLYHG